ncbi:hypothetical protein MGYG_03572 [Nannizzia gypsea CBS 118893]|uniref:Uncharacterized protein n=1 Tax=Arthroderma gypseum (strain ATCC MYA-4604 / CBS 118893) TaxID=535722 RepID=E4USQ3_ARTGP|nr:hypothetical protein MGYG_03572 [Nannizzia gypsea CBS 118893]EFR00568.1 hypothetical protein MGYG_03572 [Nannizzia gypsea CBS 118893]
MRLRQRDNIRAPERYGGGDWVGKKASGRRGASKAASETLDDLPRQPHVPLIARPTAGPPPFVDYDPNSPPAAFPTLDSPRPEGMPPQNNKPDSPGSPANEFQSEPWSDMESSEEDGSGEDSDHSVDVEDYKYLHAPTYVEWKDLNPVIQMEIIQNLTQVYTWPRVVYMLELTPQQQEDAFQSPARRQKQVEDEARELHEMQVKQLRALLRIDNSVLRKSRVPGQLVFRSISKQYFREAKNRTAVDHLMIKASELLAARRFLRRLGIDTKYAGEWKNDLATINQAHEENGEDEFKWILSSEETERSSSNPPAQAEFSSSSFQPHNGSANGPDRCFANHAGNPEVGTCSVPLYEGPSVPINSTPLNAAQQILGRRKSAKKPDRKPPTWPMTANPGNPIVRLNVGPEGAAQIHNAMHIATSLSPQSPQNLSSSPPVPLTSTSSHPPSSSLVVHGGTIRGKSYLELESHPPRSSMKDCMQQEPKSEIERQCFGRPIGRLPPVSRMSLPIRNLTPLNNHQATPMPHSDDTIAQTPPPGYSSPASQYNAPSDKNFKNLAIKVPNNNVQTKMTSASSENSEHGPPYSPISPIMGTFSVPQAQAAPGVTGQIQNDNPTKIEAFLKGNANENDQNDAVSSVLDDGASSTAEPVGSPASLPSEVKSSRPSSVDPSHPALRAASETSVPDVKFPEAMVNFGNISIATTFAVCCDIPPIESVKKEEYVFHPADHPPTVKREITNEEHGSSVENRPANKKAKLAPTDRRRSSRLSKTSTIKEKKTRVAPSVTKKCLGKK